MPFAPFSRGLGAEEIVVAYNGADGVAAAEQSELDLALVDIGLPDRSGLSHNKLLIAFVVMGGLVGVWSCNGPFGFERTVSGPTRSELQARFSTLGVEVLVGPAIWL